MTKISERIPTKVSDLDNDLPSPDWQESDQSSPAYIENRTHWKEEETISLIKVDNVQISGRAPVSIGTAYQTLEVGDTIIFNGDDECTATAFGETILVYDENTDFYLIFYPDHSVKFTCGTNGTYNVDAKLVSKTVHKLDNEYLNLDTQLDSTSDNPVANKAVNAALQGKISDVQVNGTSVVNDGVAEIPKAAPNILGAVKPNDMGVVVNDNGELYITKATSSQMKAGTNNYAPIVSSNQHESAFYGLAKAAGDATQSASSNAIGTYTEEAKMAIREMLGLPRHTESELISDVVTEEDTTTAIVNTDLNGQPFQLRTMKVIALIQASTTGTSDDISCRAQTKNMQDENSYAIFPTMKMYDATGSQHVYEGEIYGNGLFFIKGGACRITGGSSNSVVTYCDPNYLVKCFCGIELSQYNDTSTLIPAGTRILIYGIRA